MQSAKNDLTDAKERNNVPSSVSESISMTTSDLIHGPVIKTQRVLLVALMSS